MTTTMAERALTPRRFLVHALTESALRGRRLRGASGRRGRACCAAGRPAYCGLRGEGTGLSALNFAASSASFIIKSGCLLAIHAPHNLPREPSSFSSFFCKAQGAVREDVVLRVMSPVLHNRIGLLVGNSVRAQAAQASPLLPFGLGQGRRL